MRSHPYRPPPPLPPILDGIATALSPIIPNQQPLPSYPALAHHPYSASTTALPYSHYHQHRHSRTNSGYSLDDLDLDLAGSSGAYTASVPLAELGGGRDDDGDRLLPPRTSRAAALANLLRTGTHRVRVQGKLAVVRSVSVANLRSPTAVSAGGGGTDGSGGAGGGGGGGGSSTVGSAGAAGTTLASPTVTSPRDSVRFVDAAVGSYALPMRRSDDERRRRRRVTAAGIGGDTVRGGGSDRGSSEDEDEVEALAIAAVNESDAQLRGYGIGGVGNIREFGPLSGGMCVVRRSLTWKP